MNQPNKEERSSAEAGEKRAWAKENIVRSHTYPTQCGQMGVPGIERCASRTFSLLIRGGSRMRERRSYGSVRGAVSDDCPYRDSQTRCAFGSAATRNAEDEKAAGECGAQQYRETERE
jgi:hypothetical protein